MWEDFSPFSVGQIRGFGEDGLARAIRIDASGRAKVVEQFNAPDSSAQLSCAVVLPALKVTVWFRPASASAARSTL